MPPDYFKTHAIYNTQFVAHVMYAKFLGRKTFRFKNTKYVTKDYIKGVKEDIDKGFHSIGNIKKEIEKMSNIEKKKINQSDSIIVKYIVDAISKNPIVFIPIIKTIMDPKNPDSSKLRDCVADSVSNAIIDDKEMKKLCYERILENIRNCTDKEIFKIVNEQRVTLEEDSKKFIKAIQERVTIRLCEKYFNEQKANMDAIFKEYFTKLSNVIKENMQEIEAKTKEVLVEENKKASATVHIPITMKDKVVEYVKFLKSQN